MQVTTQNNITTHTSTGGHILKEVKTHINTGDNTHLYRWQHPLIQVTAQNNTGDNTY